MRKILAKRDQIRSTFTGRFERYGTKSGYHGYVTRTVLLRDIKDVDGKRVTDHLWFNFTKQIEALGELKPGTIVQFNARVKPYEKGYVNRREGIDERQTDYKLNYPTKVTIRIKRGEA